MPDQTLSPRGRWLAFAVLCLGNLMIVLDSTIVNVALPSVRADLGFSAASLAWVVNAYLLTFGGFLLLGGRLADIYGQRLDIQSKHQCTVDDLMIGVELEDVTAPISAVTRRAWIGHVQTASECLARRYRTHERPIEVLRRPGHGAVQPSGACHGAIGVAG